MEINSSQRDTALCSAALAQSGTESMVPLIPWPSTWAPAAGRPSESARCLAARKQNYIFLNTLHVYSRVPSKYHWQNLPTFLVESQYCMYPKLLPPSHVTLKHLTPLNTAQFLESCLAIAPFNITLPLYFWNFFSNSDFLWWHKASPLMRQKWSFLPCNFASRVTSAPLFTVASSQGGSFCNFLTPCRERQLPQTCALLSVWELVYAPCCSATWKHDLGTRCDLYDSFL